MSEQPDFIEPPEPPLKVVEQEPDPGKPWSDDVLYRQMSAAYLEGVVSGQDVPFVISVDGRWGTGKTFLLKRWQRDLEKQGWQAIYYNAWEDDFADDPLLAITGQLFLHVEKGGSVATLRELARLGAALVDVAAPYAPWGLGHIWALVRGVVRLVRRAKRLPEPMRHYLDRRATTREFQMHLAKLGAEVRERTGHPLVFIVDELDRCRPTFAIELLERVKHLFDVPNVVFVFGINRGELVKSLQSVYGEIDAGTYLRRFFDMEFTLPEPDAMQFCQHLARRYGLYELGAEGRLPTPASPVLALGLPTVLGRMNFSLRDMDYCVRLIALATRELAARDLVQAIDSNQSPAPYEMDFCQAQLLVLLVAVKVRNPELYRRFVNGEARGAEVIDYFDDCRTAVLRRPRRSDQGDPFPLSMIEAAFYCADDHGQATSQLEQLLNGVPPTPPLYISRRAAAVVGKSAPGSERTRSVYDQMLQHRDDHASFVEGLETLCGVIDLYDEAPRW